MNKISDEVTVISASAEPVGKPQQVSCIVQLTSKEFQYPKVISDSDAADQMIAWFDKVNKGSDYINVEVVYTGSKRFMEGYRVFDFELLERGINEKAN